MANSRVGSHPSHGGQLVVNSTSSFSLVPNDSGKTFIMIGAAVRVTLPTLSTDIAGFEITLISGDDSEHVVGGGASKIYGHAIDGSGTAAETVLPLTGHTSITMTGAAIGDKMECTTDGTNWYLYAINTNQVTPA